MPAAIGSTHMRAKKIRGAERENGNTRKRRRQLTSVELASRVDKETLFP